ncbi:peptide chain release factor subunit 1 [Actinopolymorpha cephalotaxi]|uniref:Peptide chain release factor subunit 1 n=1 Tax=Actinopolymorpha cephalotaxi TaxID=504797 RepID=A0A1I2VN13_9ACTN|nr:hypothetical protein [Actinopolymorpha cephalotaxi]NYH83329.1 peptide chain release factor subunit 1 [Actinopolymorpha cephalotaxi]SFG88581.1 peptide chain release factor subunit 1 [Actinopolymorpha cephalotaxi]
MIDARQVERLLGYRDPDGAVLSLYVDVPAQPVAIREMLVRVDNLLAEQADAARDAPHTVRRELAEARTWVREALATHVRDWLGHGVALLAAPSLGLHEAMPVSWPVHTRVVADRRPYVRPLLSALHHARPYYVVVVERREAWIFRVDGESIESVSKLVGDGVRDSSHAGWAGYEEYNTRHRAAELARRHYRSTAATVEKLLAANGRDLVVGGHEVGIVEFVGQLPDAVRRRLVGTFVVDPHTMTAGDVRDLSARARDRRRREHELRVLAEVADREANGLAVSGIEACGQAVNRGQAAMLVVRDDAVVAGFDCETCGELTPKAAATCPHCGGPLRPVYDLVDELLARVVQQGGQVEFADQVSGAGGSGEPGSVGPAGEPVSAMVRSRLVRPDR